MLRLVVFTQIRENYGAHDWDGVGECPQYWKSKGGRDITIAHLSYSQASVGFTQLNHMVLDLVRKLKLESDNDYFQETMIDWELLEPGELTHEEQLKAKYGY